MAFSKRVAPLIEMSQHSIWRHIPAHFVLQPNQAQSAFYRMLIKVSRSELCVLVCFVEY